MPQGASDQVLRPLTKLLNIGVDFGTSSTKVVLRDVNQDLAYAYAHDDPVEPFGPYCWPTTIREHCGRLFFGNQAERMSGGTAMRSLKMCIPCMCGAFQANKVKGRGCDRPMCQADGDLGLFVIGADDESILEVPATQLCALYLGMLLSDVLSHVKDRPPLEGDLEVTTNMAAPLDLEQQPEVKMQFERVLYVADQLRGIRQGIRVAEAVSLVRGAWSSSGELPGESGRSTFVIPETLAATAGYGISRKAEPGLYVIADVGAGTTDIAVFRYCGNAAERELVFYSAATQLVGCDDIDRIIADVVLEESVASAVDRRRIVADARAAKHQCADYRIEIAGTSVSLVDVERRSSDVLDSMFRAYKRTVWRGYHEKEKRPDAWQHLNILLHGGGNQLLAVSDTFQESPNIQTDGMIKNTDLTKLSLPRDLPTLGPGAAGDLAKYGHLMIVARGLSFHRGELPDHFAPGDVEPVPPPRVYTRNTDHVSTDPG